MVLLRKKNTFNDSVLHISLMVHVPYHTTRILRKIGMKADYMAKGKSAVWNKCDYEVPDTRPPFLQAIKEIILFWQVVAKYEAVHLHFGHTMSRSGWELSFLKRLGRKIIIHYRGCEIRDYNVNSNLHPSMNICQQCDYDRSCLLPANKIRMSYVQKYGDTFLVTTPDLLDFAPSALHMPFFCPEDENIFSVSKEIRYPKRPLRILHWTNHPGIEGTGAIRLAVLNLQEKGYAVELVIFKGVSFDEIQKKLSDVDLTIGKMKMGYYANSQIEAMAAGVPTITWVRPELSTESLQESGFIFTHINNLEVTLEYLLNNPEEIEKKRCIARKSIQKLHNNLEIANKYRNLYQNAS